MHMFFLESSKMSAFCLNENCCILIKISLNSSYIRFHRQLLNISRFGRSARRTLPNSSWPASETISYFCWITTYIIDMLYMDSICVVTVGLGITCWDTKLEGGCINSFIVLPGCEKFLNHEHIFRHSPIMWRICSLYCAHNSVFDWLGATYLGFRLWSPNKIKTHLSPNKTLAILQTRFSSYSSLNEIFWISIRTQWNMFEGFRWQLLHTCAGNGLVPRAMTPYGVTLFQSRFSSAIFKSYPPDSMKHGVSRWQKPHFRQSHICVQDPGEQIAIEISYKRRVKMFSVIISSIDMPKMPCKF